MLLLILLLSLLPISTGWAATASIDIYVDIVKPTQSSALQIEAPKYVFTTNYDTSQETFHDLYIPFTVVNPKSDSVSNYEITLFDVQNRCSKDADEQPIPVTVFLNEQSFAEGESLTFSNFVVEDETDQWTHHELTVAFEVLPQNTYGGYYCDGHLSLIVEEAV